MIMLIVNKINSIANNKLDNIAEKLSTSAVIFFC